MPTFATFQLFNLDLHIDYNISYNIDYVKLFLKYFKHPLFRQSSGLIDTILSGDLSGSGLGIGNNSTSLQTQIPLPFGRLSSLHDGQ